MPEDAFDPEDAAARLIDAAIRSADLIAKIEVAREAGGSPEIPELARSFNLLQFDVSDYIQKLDDAQQGAQVVGVLAVVFAEDLMTAYRTNVHLHNAGAVAAAGLNSIRKRMIMPDHPDAARVAEIAETFVRSFDDAETPDSSELLNELAALHAAKPHYMRPVMKSLAEAVAARRAVPPA